MVSNQAPSSVSINGWNQTSHLSHLLTVMVVSGSCHALGVSFYLQGCQVWCSVFTAQGHPAKGSEWRLSSSPHSPHKPCALAGTGLHVPSIRNTFFLVCSKVHYGQRPLPCPMCTPSVRLSPFSPTIPSLRWGGSEGSVYTRAAAVSLEELCLLSPAVLFPSLSMLRVASQNCSAVINTPD